MEKYRWGIPVNRHTLPMELVPASLGQQYTTLDPKPGGSANRFLHAQSFAVTLCYISAG